MNWGPYDYGSPAPVQLQFGAVFLQNLTIESILLNFRWQLSVVSGQCVCEVFAFLSAFG
jgi:hypothetical protein